MISPLLLRHTFDSSKRSSMYNFSCKYHVTTPRNQKLDLGNSPGFWYFNSASCTPLFHSAACVALINEQSGVHTLQPNQQHIPLDYYIPHLQSNSSNIPMFCIARPTLMIWSGIASKLKQHMLLAATEKEDSVFASAVRLRLKELIVM